jgi:hypothetical protein
LLVVGLLVVGWLLVAVGAAYCVDLLRIQALSFLHLLAVLLLHR